MANFRKISNQNEWQNLLDRTLFKTFFHTLKWESFLESEFKWLKFERYVYENSAVAAGDSAGEQALLSLARFKAGNKEKLISHPFCEYGGPLPLVESINGDKFKQDLLENFQDKIKVSFHPKLLNHFVFARPGFAGIGAEEANQRQTYILENLDKQDIKALWQESLDRNRRRAIGKAEARGVSIVELKTTTELKQVYNFYVKSLKKHKNIVYPFSFFKMFFDIAADRGKTNVSGLQSKIILAKLGKENLGGNIFIAYNNILHSFLCGFDERYKGWGAHSLVLWRAMQTAKKSGFEMFDFGAAKKNSALAEFKQRWGAKPRSILELKNYTDDGKLQKSWLRNLWGFLPVGLIKTLSPYFIKRRF